MTTLRTGGVAPEAYQMVLAAGTSGVDLSTVTSAVIRVKGPDGVESTWTAGMSSQSSSALTLTHTFGGEVTVVGEYELFAELTVPSGTNRSHAVSVTVVDEFDV